MGDVADIQISLLDGVGLTAAGVEIALRGDRQRALLARLALSRGSEAVHRATHSWVDGLIGHDEELLGVAADGLSAVGRHRDAAVCRGDVARIGR